MLFLTIKSMYDMKSLKIIKILIFLNKNIKVLCRGMINSFCHHLLLIHLILKLERAACASIFIFIFLMFLGIKELIIQNPPFITAY